MVAGEAVSVHYYEGEIPRFLKGKLIGEDENFIKVELNRYVVRISKQQIIKIETVKPGWSK